MKNLFPLFFLLISIVSFSQTEVFRGSFDELEEEATKNKKPYIVDFSTSWCGYCKKFDREVMPDTSFSSLVNQQFLFGRVDGDKRKDLVSKYKVRGYPTFIIFNKKGEEIKRFNGYVDAQSFVRSLNYLGYKEEGVVTVSLAKYEEEKTAQFNEIILQQGLELRDKASKAGRTRDVLAKEDLIIHYPKEDAYINFFYDYAANGFDVEKVKLAFDNKVIDNNQSHHLLLENLLEHKVKADTACLLLINTLLLDKPGNYYLLDTKAYIYFSLGQTKNGEQVAKQAKKIASKQKIDFTATTLLLKAL